MTAARPTSPRAASAARRGIARGFERRLVTRARRAGTSAQPSGTNTTYFIARGIVGRPSARSLRRCASLSMPGVALALVVARDDARRVQRRRRRRQQHCGDRCTGDLRRTPYDHDLPSTATTAPAVPDLAAVARHPHGGRARSRRARSRSRRRADDDRFYVAEQGGRVRIVDHGETVERAGARRSTCRAATSRACSAWRSRPTARSCTSTTPIPTATRTSTSTR